VSGLPDESFSVKLTRGSTVYAIQINFADENSTQTGRVFDIYYQYLIQTSDNNVEWRTIANKSTNTQDNPHEYIQLSASPNCTFVRILNVHVPSPMRFSLFRFRIFARQSLPPPSAPQNLTAFRHSDSRSVTRSWNLVLISVGYNGRFGPSSNKLYHDYIVYDHTNLDIHSLFDRHNYWFTIDSFNEGGITTGTAVVHCSGPYVSVVFDHGKAQLSISNGMIGPVQVREWQSQVRNVSLGPNVHRGSAWPCARS
jgi:hypothetical protein